MALKTPGNKIVLPVILVTAISFFLIIHPLTDTTEGVQPGDLSGDSLQAVQSVDPEQGSDITSPKLMDAHDPNDRIVTINMTGDILLASRVGEVIKQKGTDYPWLGIRDILSSADITVGNLECAVSDKSYKPIPDKQYTFLASPEALAGMQNSGINVVTLANNHILDFGAGAMGDTLALLKEYGISYTGAGKDIKQAAAPVLIEKNGLKVGVLAFSFVFPEGWWVAGSKHLGIASGYDHDLVYRSVEELNATADLTIVSLHWGEELAEQPTNKEKNIAHKLVDLGADIILGHHPHVLQGLEKYKHGLICYSAGNFIFTQSRDVRARQSIILQVEAGSNGIKGARVIPMWIEYGRTVLADEAEYTSIINRMQTLSEPFATMLDESGELVS